MLVVETRMLYDKYIDKIGSNQVNSKIEQVMSLHIDQLSLMVQ
jgi:hypothetical protein